MGVVGRRAGWPELFVLLLAAVNCGSGSEERQLRSDGGEAEVAPPAMTGNDPVIAAAGDISCPGCAQLKTAALILDLLHHGRVDSLLPLGDEAYTHGSLSEFEASYAPSWGVPELLAITHPVPGNHEYEQPDGAGYFDYFQSAHTIAGERSQGYYSFDVGSWHLVALNTSDGCHAVSCDAGSPQQVWLAADLRAHPNKCTLAFWHNPRFQGGTENGETERAGPLWETFVDAGGDVVLNGHEHNYQQLAPLDRNGAVDPVGGVRTFVVGTGGAGFHTAFGAPHEFAIETRVVDQHGILELTLMDAGYRWRFITVDGTVPDGASGGGGCR